MDRKKNTRFVLLPVVFSTWLWVSIASGSPLDLYGLSSRSIGMGGAVSAAASDYSALYYNPGRMGYVAPSFGFHFIASFDKVAIRLKDRPAGYDVPKSVYDARPMNGSKMLVRYMPTSELEAQRGDTTDDPNLYAISGGIVHDFGLYWLRIGAAFYLPLTKVAAADFHFVDEREQFFSNRLHFQLLNRRAERPAVLAGVAFRPLKWFGFGASLNAFGNLVTKTRMFVPDPTDQENIHFLVSAEMKYDAAIIAGVHFEPFDWMGIGIVFRDRSWFDAEIRNELRFWSFDIYEGEPTTIQKFKYAYSYSPRQLAGGLRFNLDEWVFSTDVAWLMWSDFRPELDDGNATGFRDIVTYRAGVEWRPLKWLDVRAGGGWLPSPVTKQDGRTNYVDNNKVELASGATFYIPKVEGLSIDIHAQFVILVERHQWKSMNAKSAIIDEFPTSRYEGTEDSIIPESRRLQTNNPGFPGYSSEGFIGSAGLGLTYKFK